MGGNGKHRWKISFHHRSNSNPKPTLPPKDFLCPITGSLMSDPVVVSSGQTFERVSAQVCRDLGFSPTLEDVGNPVPDFTNIIPNLAIKSTILSWCDSTGAERPTPPDYSAVEKIVRAKMVDSGSLKPEIGASERELLKGVAENRPVLFAHAATEVTRRVNRFYSSSEESVVVGDEPGSPFTPLPLATRPACYTSSSNSSSEVMEAETLNLTQDSNSGNSGNSGPISNSSSEIMEAEPLNLTQDSNSGYSGPISPVSEEQEIVAKLKSLDVHEQEESVISLRKLTRAREDLRIPLCTPRLLAALRSLIASRYSAVQTNAIASLVNLSLARANKVTIVRSGFVPLLIDVLIAGSIESQDHAAGALFSLALEDENKMAIGVLGALQPLMHGLRSESEPTRHDSALALYHLSLIQSNRVKLVKLGAVPALLSMVSGEMASRLLLILCNLAACNEGRSAMLDGNAVAILVEMMREDESEATRENCVAALFALSHGSLRFKGLAKEAKAVEVLREIEERGSHRGREKAKKILQMMKGRREEDGQWGGILESEGTTRGRYSVSGATRNRKSWNC